MNCCVNCFGDLKIIAYIQKIAVISDCDFCNSQQIETLNTENVGEFIRQGFMRAYEHVESFTGAMWDGEEREYIDKFGNKAGESLFYILNDTEKIFSEDFTEDDASYLLEFLIKDSGLTDREKMQGEWDDLDDIYNPCFVRKNDLYGRESTREYNAWKSFKHQCKYFNRYFDIASGHSSRENLLNEIGDIFLYMNYCLDTSISLFRARKFNLCDGEKIDCIDYYREIAPSPAKFSVNNRMSPAGISYMYLSNNIETCFKEIRLNNDENALIGKFTVRRNLKILDLSQQPSLPKSSIFDDKYRDWDWINEFISDFTVEISKPIGENEKDIEYIATQLLSEYIRKIGYDGIKFESSLNKNTDNFVLFCGPNPDLCRELYDYDYFDYMEDELEYFTDQLKLEEISYYKYDIITQVGKVIDQKTNIDDIEEDSFSSYDSREFRDISKIRKALIEMQEELEYNYIIKNQNVIPNLYDKIEGLISEFPANAKKVIFVQKGFHFIDISVVVKLPDGNKTLLDLTCMHKKADSMWENLLRKN